MPSFVDLTGTAAGAWSVLRRLPGQPTKFFCRCACGQEREVLSGSLLYGRSRDCGCGRRGGLVARNTIHGASRRNAETRAYGAWKHMRRRCFSREDKDFAMYGGRGITIAPEWNDYRRFLADMGEPAAGLTLDRIDTDGNYSKENCRWATRAQQTANRRPFKQEGLKGEASPSSRLTEAMVRQIRERCGEQSQARIAAEYGVSQSLVSAIVTRKAWGHVR